MYLVCFSHLVLHRASITTLSQQSHRKCEGDSTLLGDASLRELRLSALPTLPDQVCGGLVVAVHVQVRLDQAGVQVRDLHRQPAVQGAGGHSPGARLLLQWCGVAQPVTQNDKGRE